MLCVHALNEQIEQMELAAAQVVECGPVPERGPWNVTRDRRPHAATMHRTISVEPVPASPDPGVFRIDLRLRRQIDLRKATRDQTLSEFAPAEPDSDRAGEFPFAVSICATLRVVTRAAASQHARASR